MADEKNGAPLADAARTIGSTVGKVVSAVGGGKKGGGDQDAAPTSGSREGGQKAASPGAKADAPQAENVWQAEYMGSGTFIIHKPKRSDRKRHSQMVRNRRRGMRTF